MKAIVDVVVAENEQNSNELKFEISDRERESDAIAAMEDREVMVWEAWPRLL